MHEKSIALLNHAVADELAAVHQYMFFHFHLDDQGYDALASLFKRTAIMEMGHVEILAERILFLKGEVEMKAAGEVQNVTDVKEILKLARDMEDASAKDYNAKAKICAENADSATKKIFENLVGDEEKHFDQFDKEVGKIETFGDRYLALQSIDGGKSEASAD